MTEEERKEEAQYNMAMEKARQADLRAESREGKRTEAILRRAEAEDARRGSKEQKEEAQYNVAMQRAKQAELKAEARAAAQRDKEEYQAGKEHAQGLAFQKKKWEGRRERVEKETEYFVGKPVGLAARLGAGIFKGASLVAKLKGIKTEDQIIHNKELYGMGNALNPAFTPLGRTYDRNNPMELYFGRKSQGKMPEGTQTVYVSMQQGYEVEQLEVITGLDPNQVMRAIQYLKQKKLWQEEWE